MNTRYLSLAAASLLTMTVTTTAHADTLGTTNARIVAYSDLDLTHRAGVETLLRRIERAGESVCAQYRSRSPDRARLYVACRDDAIARAVAKVGDAQLAMLHRSKSARGATAGLMTAR